MATFFVQNDTDRTVYLQSIKNDRTIEVKAHSNDSTHLFTDEVYNKVSGKIFLRPDKATYYKVVVSVRNGILQLNSERLR